MIYNEIYPALAKTNHHLKQPLALPPSLATIPEYSHKRSHSKAENILNLNSNLKSNYSLNINTNFPYNYGYDYEKSYTNDIKEIIKEGSNENNNNNNNNNNNIFLMNSPDSLYPQISTSNDYSLSPLQPSSPTFNNNLFYSHPFLSYGSNTLSVPKHDKERRKSCSTIDSLEPILEE